MDYIVTFFTHYDAVNCSRRLEKKGVSIRLAPVPRKLSSSCGTCAFLTTSRNATELLAGIDFEKLFRKDSGDDYELLVDHGE